VQLAAAVAVAVPGALVLSRHVIVVKGTESIKNNVVYVQKPYPPNRSGFHFECLALIIQACPGVCIFDIFYEVDVCLGHEEARKQRVGSWDVTRSTRASNIVAPKSASRWNAQVAKAVADAIGADKVGMRLSPYGTFLDAMDSDPIPGTRYLIQQLSDLGLAYVHVVEGRIVGNTTKEEDSSQTLQPFRDAFKVWPCSPSACESGWFCVL
jgi:hypothetical protein